MAKGFFTQGIVILLSEAVSVDDIAARLEEYAPSKPLPPADRWEMSGPSVMLVMDEDDSGEEGNGKIAVDIVSQPWPDNMGDPENEPIVFGAWGMGHFGPFAYPGSLFRATQQSWTWEEGKTLPPTHQAFIRVRSSYVFGADDEAPVIPENYEPFDELALVTEVAAELTELPQAICYFNPNGEVLRDLQTLNESFEYAEENDFPPLDLWANVRLFNLENEWAAMDTVGNAQLDLMDVEACFHAESYDFGEVEQFLRLVTCYLVEQEEEMGEGDTMEGPGDVIWQAHVRENSLVDPPRRVFRCIPLDERDIPEQILANQAAE